MDRETRCVLSWDVVQERTTEALQACLERAPQAKQYYSDALPAYDTLYYGAPYEMRTDKQETYAQAHRERFKQASAGRPGGARHV